MGELRDPPRLGDGSRLPKVAPVGLAFPLLLQRRYPSSEAECEKRDSSSGSWKRCWLCRVSVRKYGSGTYPLWLNIMLIVPPVFRINTFDSSEDMDMSMAGPGSGRKGDEMVVDGKSQDGRLGAYECKVLSGRLD